MFARRRPVWVMMAATLSASCTGSEPNGDLVLTNGNVITLDAQDRTATAVAIRGERIVFVGDDGGAESFIGPDTRHIDLEGRTVTPGLLDAHAHFNGGAVSRMFVLDLSYPTVQSVADIVDAVEAQVAVAQPGDWILGRGWDEGKLEELRYVLASDLDPIAPDNPVWLTHTMGHYGTANSVALALADVTSETADPPGGTIDHTADGAPTGVLKESAQGLVRGLVPDFTPAQMRQGMASLADAFNAECMTGLKDPGVSEDAFEAYRQVMSEGDLTVRVFALWRAPSTVEATEDLVTRIASSTRPYDERPDDRLISGGVKLYVDGSGGARTAWLYDDWHRERTDVDVGNTGYPTRDPEIIRAQIKLLHAAGIHVSVHSIGDRGIDWTVDSFAQALEEHPVSGLRHGIIHANIPTDHAIEEIARLQREFDAAYPEPSPAFTWWIGDTYAGNFGVERSMRLNPFRTFQEQGILWAAGSDYTVTPFPARYGIWSSVARETVRGVYGETPFGTEEAVDVATALRAQTTWVARQMFLDDAIGTIEVGKYADLGVWDRDPYSVPTAQLQDMQCQATVFNGDVVYEREAGASAP
ncbi:MAG: amidohydrolase [Longimicrobiales bacterium]